VAATLACLFAASSFATPAAAGRNLPTYYLYGSRSGGWGSTNTSLTTPGPLIEVEVGDNVTLNLTSLDVNRNHNWFIDYNNNSAVDANESYSDSGTFRSHPVEFNFTVGNHTGTFAYRSRFNGDGNMWGNITIRTAGSSAGGLGGNLLLIGGIVLVVVAVLAIAAVAYRRARQPPPPQ
jgi:heme/copper-type cytochrome/quinol oxidase subunit 2